MTTTERFMNGISGKKKTIINDKSGAFSKENAPLFSAQKMQIMPNPVDFAMIM